MMAAAELLFCRRSGPGETAECALLIVGQSAHLSSLSWEDVRDVLLPRVHEQTWQRALRCLQADRTDVCPLWLNMVTVAALPPTVSRHNTPSSAHTLTRLVETRLGAQHSAHIMVVCEKSSVFASACAVARAFPLFSRKSERSPSGEDRRVSVEFFCVEPRGERLSDSALECLSRVTQSVRLAARIVDSPCSDMDTERFLQEVRAVAVELRISPVIIRSEELCNKGFGGIYGVGKGASSCPALAVLSHTPPAATQTIAWVGKGVVYDTGGLILKGKTQLPGMKRDCAGAAAILGAFSAAVKQGFKENLHAVLCLAENCTGPRATRPDDIHRLYSGKTVEIRNTDAEGRLLLADGVVYALRDLKANVILDMATLTGAQGVATGRYHGALLTNDEDWERACVAAGRSSGDLVQPLVYTPELHFSEFSSAMADMKNFDRSKAPCSCAGLFIGAQLGFSWSGVWIHVDMASPAYSGERATGYGVALLLALFGRSTDDALLQLISPAGLELERHSGASEVAKAAPKRRKLI